jgi:hypothetical protein
MTELQSFECSWEGTDNPNDPSGVACFKVGSESVNVLMQDLPQALKLFRLIEKACAWQKQQTIDRAISDLTGLLNSHRYD